MAHYIRRSVTAPPEQEVFWIGANLDEETRRNRALYCGKDVNGAIQALVKDGVAPEEAIKLAQAELDRLAKKQNEVTDSISPR